MNSERRCGIVPLSRRSASDWEGEGNDRRSWGEVLQARKNRVAKILLVIDKFIGFYQEVSGSA